MTWHLLSFIVPAYSFYRSITTAYYDYKKYEKSAPHPLSKDVMKIVKDILEAENIQRPMLFKIINGKKDAEPAFTRMVHTKEGAKYYIILHPEIKEPFLPWVITREVSHILNNSEIFMDALKVTASFTMSFTTSFGALANFSNYLHCITAWGLTAVSPLLAQGVYTHISEERADDFAIKHCSNEELKRGVALLEEMQKIRLQSDPVRNPLDDFFHPPEYLRIEKIRQHLCVKKKEDNTAVIKILSASKA